MAVTNPQWVKVQNMKPSAVTRARRRERDMAYVLAASSSPSFALKGLAGYEFQALKHEDIAVHLVDVYGGHDTFMISKVLARLYYIIEGTGVFTIDNQKYDVTPGLLVEVPPGVEYSYSGSMKILLVSHPRWFEGNERITRKNPDVVSSTDHGGGKRRVVIQWTETLRKQFLSKKFKKV
jgi:mannose-6-phosphate isomerase-like protein (cupin superfamily)